MFQPFEKFVSRALDMSFFFIVAFIHLKASKKLGAHKMLIEA